MDMKQLEFIVDGKGAKKSETRLVKIVGHRCIDSCLAAVNDQGAISANFIYWSDASNWPDNKLPVAG